ncbi:MRC1-like domain-containing protein [Podospora appendiculata]|uniref:MRC1-like domain-containing protein n=1 Tax=Podospora appendiculata TaxID=314037 RepID=A0AAE1C9R3_9PEZI|nr:MRC1-like domain-containing protein [Podospora appendiculata]KAK3684721.1 MRC1-like domain-containing protein [Podospora appendiculata]
MASSPTSERGSRSASATPTRTPATHLPTHHHSSPELSDSSDEEEDIFRPRGKLASRMQVREDSPHQALNKSSGDAPTAARDDDDDDDVDDDDDDEDDVVTTRPRKLKPRTQRSSTPETRPQADAPSPSLFVSPEKPAPDSPGLFVSPSKPWPPSNAGEGLQSDGNLPSVISLTKSERYLVILERKRKEREAREAEEARRRAERLAVQNTRDDDMIDVDDDDDDDDDSNITDDEGGRKLTQEGSRPSRKASKKALEDINRETQRLARNMQLGHEAKVKKKITKASFFERFNFKPEGAATPPAATVKLPTSSRQGSPTASTQPTDAEAKDSDTPPSSPPVNGDTSPGKAAQASPSHDDLPVVERLLSEDEDGELPTLEAVLASSAAKKKLDKGKGKATAADLEAEQPKQPAKAKRHLRVKFPAIQANRVSVSLDDEDDELEVQSAPKTKIDAIFDRLPANQAKESRSLHFLRKIAQVDDPEKKATAPTSRNARQKPQPTMTVGELEMSLLQRARIQAKLERDRHVEMLRAKGIHVPTAEEREEEMAEVENMVARARAEAEGIMKRERDAAKKDRKAKKDSGEVDPLAWDDSEDDEDYEEVEEEEPVALELSGSEDEDADGAEAEDEDVDMDSGAEEDDEAEEADPAGVLFDNIAESAEESEAEDTQQQLGAQDSDEELASSRVVRQRPRKHITILSDDDDDDDEEELRVEATPRPKAKFPKSPVAPNTKSPKVPMSVLRSATKTFIPGISVAGPAGLGLTQIFAGTMDDSQVGSNPAMGSPSQPMPTFDTEAFPDSNFSQTAQEAMEDMILDSQPNRKEETQGVETQGIQIRFSQSQMHGFDSLLEEKFNTTQMSELLEPTQDGGFQDFSPLRQRFVEPPLSTVETVKADGTQAETANSESPLVRRTGKLRRRADIPVMTAPSADSDAEVDDAMEGVETDEFGFGTVSATTAFTVMKQAALKEKKAKAADAFDKTKSKAREMVHDQAEESEDEYAGLGGVDGEGESDDDEGSVKEMIDDETKNNEGDERKIAAFYADRERAADEKQVDKLFKDITTGGLRRKRGGDWDDLSDSDDGGEAKRRMKRRQFAKMQRALFADERISKVAENPRNQAFLRTIEDHGSDDDMDFIFAPPPVLESQGSQSSVSADPETTTIPDSQPTTSRPAANPRRTKEGKKPSNIGDIRESLSNLFDEPLNFSSVIPATELGSDSDGEAEDHGNKNNISSSTIAESPRRTKTNKENPRRTTARGSVTIVDRISLKRNSSSIISNASGQGTRLAFATTTNTTTTTTSSTTKTNANPATSSITGFKVPALLRRATTNSLLSTGSTTSSGGGIGSTTLGGVASASASGFGDDAKIKKTTTTSKRSGVNYFARENERRAALAEGDKRREAKKLKGVAGRSKIVGGLFAGGKFE